MRKIILLFLLVWVVHYYRPLHAPGGFVHMVYKTDKKPIVQKGGYASTWMPYLKVELPDKNLYLPIIWTWIEEKK